VGTNTTRTPLTPGRRQALLAAVLSGAVILLFRSWLEADMARHMLIEFPLLLVAGLSTAKALPERAVAFMMRFNRLGLAGFTFVSLTAAYWMIPVTLDRALLSGPAAAAKYTSLLAAGMLLPVSFPAAPLAMQTFFVGNWVWMTATVGLLYQNAPQQLCVNYLVGTQLSAGEGLVAAAVAIAGLWCVYAAPAYLEMTR
jgi:hypothetical protein